MGVLDFKGWLFMLEVLLHWDLLHWVSAFILDEYSHKRCQHHQQGADHADKEIMWDLSSLLDEATDWHLLSQVFGDRLTFLLELDKLKHWARAADQSDSLDDEEHAYDAVDHVEQTQSFTVADLQSHDAYVLFHQLRPLFVAATPCDDLFLGAVVRVGIKLTQLSAQVCQLTGLCGNWREAEELNQEKPEWYD